MKIIISAELTKGWDHFKSIFESDRHTKIRSDAKLTDLGYGYHQETNRFYVVHELESMEVMQKAMAENQGAIEEVRVDQSSMQIINLEG
jgi:hypothetical protein